MVDVLLAMIRASREGDLDLHLSRYLSSYLSEMFHLEEEHLDIFTYFKSGGFAVLLGEDDPFAKIPVN